MKFKVIIAATLGLVLSGLICACSPSPTELKEVIKKHPDIMFAAIEADPKGFFDTVQKVQSQARNASMAQEMDEEFKRVKGELKDPQKVDISADRAFKGSATAPVTIVEWADFNCGHCAQAQDTLAQILSTYGDKVRIVYKNLPILDPNTSQKAAEYMEAIAKQDKAKALKFHDYVFANQDAFHTDGLKFLNKAVKEAGANLAKVEKDAKSKAITKLIDADVAEAKKFNFNGTPGFMVNGAAIRGAYPYDFFKRVIDAILASGSNSNSNSNSAKPADKGA